MAQFRAAFSLTAVAIVASACSSSSKSSGQNASYVKGSNGQNVNEFAAPARSGIISDYNRLKPSPEYPNTLVWTSGKLGQYDRYIVDPVTIVPSASARGLEISDSEKRRLAADFRFQLVDALQASKTVVTMPMARTARVKVAVTQIARSSGERMHWFRWEGGAAAEMEISDSMTGEVLASAMDSDLVTTTEKSPVHDPYDDTKEVFKHWAARLAKWLITAR